MTRVDFYSNARDKLDIVRRLVDKSRQSGQCVLVRATDARLAGEIDRYLWTQPVLSFQPHVPSSHPLARETPVLIGDDPDALASPDVLINLDTDTPAYFGRFERLLEIVGAEEGEVLAGRERYRFYKARGYALEHHDLAGR